MLDGTGVVAAALDGTAVVAALDGTDVVVALDGTAVVARPDGAATGDVAAVLDGVAGLVDVTAADGMPFPPDATPLGRPGPAPPQGRPGTGPEIPR